MWTIGLFSVIAAGLYFALVAILTIGFIRLRNIKAITEAHLPTLSIIVAARNEAEHIGNLLNDLCAQNYPHDRYQILVVDDHSEDNTPDIARGFEGVEMILLSQLQGKKTGKKEALKAAIRQASGEILLFTDADCRVGPGWARRMVSGFSDEKTHMISGPVILTGDGGIFQSLQQLEFISLMASTAGSASLGWPLMANGANMAVRKATWNNVNNLITGQQHASGDDMFLMLAIRKFLGKKSVIFMNDADAIVTTPAEENFSEFFRQRRRWVSKSKYYKNVWINSAGLIVFAQSIILTITLIAGFFDQAFLYFAALLFSTKLIADFPLLLLATKSYKKQTLMWWYFPVQIIYPFYILTSALAGIIFKVNWKGRPVQ